MLRDKASGSDRHPIYASRDSVLTVKWDGVWNVEGWNRTLQVEREFFVWMFHLKPQKINQSLAPIEVGIHRNLKFGLFPRKRIEVRNEIRVSGSECDAISRHREN